MSQSEREVPVLSGNARWPWYTFAFIALACAVAALFVPRSLVRAQEGGEVAPTAIENFDRPTYSSPIALSADKNLLWVVNPDDDSVSVLGNLSGTPGVLAKFSVGDEPQSIALDTNNTDPSQYRAYVANAADNGITIIRVTASSASSVTAVVETPLLTTGAEPWNVVASPNGQRVFVANSGQDTITVLRTDTTPPSIVGNVDLRGSACNVGDPSRHFQPRGMAVTLNSDRLYVTRFLSFTKAGGVQADDLGKEGIVCQFAIPAGLGSLPTVTGPLALAPRETGFRIDSNGDGTPDATSAYPNQLQSVVIRGNRAYLPNIAASPSRPLRFNVDTQAFVNVINNAASGVPSDAGALNLHLGARDPEPGKKRLFFSNPWAIAFTNESGAGNAYAVSAGSDLLVKLNVNAGGDIAFTTDISTTRYIDLNDPNNGATAGANAGKNPLGIVIRNIAPGNNRAFVMNYLSRNVSVVNLDTDTVQQVIALTSLPPAGSQDEQLQVGKEMFFSSRGHFDRPGGTTVSTDERLSSEGWQNCASCHFAGLTDGNIWSFGSGPRKSVPMNATWSPHNPNDQRILNYSAIFDEVQDFELNVRNVSGPGPLNAGPPPVLDPAHGLLFGNTINDAPGAVNAFALPNAGRPQHTVTLPGSGTAWPSLDSLKEWVRFGIRTPNGALTTAELSAGGGDPAGGLNASEVSQGRRLFFQAGCQECHGGTKWTVSSKDFTSPPAAGEIAVETDGNGAAAPNPNLGQYLPRFLRDVGSFNLNVAGSGNQIAGQPLIGGAEKDAGGRDALGIDYDSPPDGKGAGFNIPGLLGIWAVPPYYHNGACETVECVLADPVHRAQGLAQGQADPLANATNRQRVAAFLKTLDAETDVPFNLIVRAHDIFLDPPTVFRGTQVTAGVNLSLFGTRADLANLAADLGISQLTVRFELSPAVGPTTIDVHVPLNAFNQDFGQAVISTTWSIPANAVGRIGTVRVRVDPDNDFAEDREGDNSARRRVRILPAPADTTPPQVTQARISDDQPFNDADIFVQTTDVRVKIVAADPASPAPAPTSGVTSFCIVSYVYDVVQRRWVEQECQFQPLPAPEGGTTDTFIVDTTLQARAGVAYAFVWVRDAAGNISRTPAFDVVSFVPGGPINLNRNDVVILRLPLATGQSVNVTADVQFGDVDIAVFEDFTNPDSARLALSANNGPVDETVTVSGTPAPGRRQVEIRAVVNTRFTLTVVEVAAVASTEGAAPAEALAAGDRPLVGGPPAIRAAITDAPQAVEVFLPLIDK
jgi:cytochrome c peroxidase